MKPAQSQSMVIRKAGRQDVKALWDLAAAMRAAKERDYFERNLEEQDKGRREIFIASVDGRDAGWCILNWDPKYGYFRAEGIPETQDLNVLPALRRQGIATAMIRHCEELARKKGKPVMGISVGVDGSYGPAQRLYARLGYVPDGFGVTYDRKTVGYGEMRPVDENLCLMMVRGL